jgi:hypothetical protein
MAPSNFANFASAASSFASAWLTVDREFFCSLETALFF